MNSGHPDTIVVGAGPAGLAVAACLKRSGIHCLMLEQSDKVGAAWHQHYERLHLHTDRAHSGLPFEPLAKDYPRYPSRLQVISYLEAYARHFQLEPSFREQVLDAHQANGGWEVQTRDGRYRAANLVVAAGYNREPCIPEWPGRASFTGAVLHSSQYRNGAAFRDQRVLVVGLGNSGGEIAIDLCEQGAQVHLAVRSPVNVIPRELFGIPILTIAILQRKLPPRLADALNAVMLRAAVGDITRYGLRRSPLGPMAQIQRRARIPLIDVGTIELLRRGRIALHAGIERFTAEEAVFVDGSRLRADAVILATGYRPRVNAFLQGAAAVHDEKGTPLTSGRETAMRGLYFCGYNVAPTGMLREIGLEARRVAAAIAGVSILGATGSCEAGQ